MKNRNFIIWLVVAVAALAVVFYLTARRGGEGKFDWQESWNKKAYSEQYDQPYGTQVLYRLLEGYFPGEKMRNIERNIAEELPIDSTARSNYVFIGEGLYLDSLGTARLLEFVGAGNTALIVSKTIPFDLMFHLYYSECDDTPWDDYDTTNDSLGLLMLGEAKANVFMAVQNKPKDYEWAFIDDVFFCDSLPQAPLGYLNDSLVNFAVFPFGAGRFFLHTTPLAFTNYHLMRPETRPYAAKVLGRLTEGPIYWDAYSRVPEVIARRRNGPRDLPNEHPLTYILKQPALAWAWYLLMGTALAYVVFRGKRRQRPIPVLAKNENSSYEFISTIANLHFREKNYQNLCIQSMKLFLHRIRERYGLTTSFASDTRQPRLDADFVQQLSRLSNIAPEPINDLLRQYDNCTRYQPTEDMMINLHTAIESFWKKAK